MCDRVELEAQLIAWRFFSALFLNTMPEGNRWRITAKVTDGTTDEDGLMCLALGLEGKLITMRTELQ
jgi:hypothetical protein